LILFPKQNSNYALVALNFTESLSAAISKITFYVVIYLILVLSLHRKLTHQIHQRFLILPKRDPNTWRISITNRKAQRLYRNVTRE